MTKKQANLEYHLKLNRKNPRHVRSAEVLASVDKRYKSSFIALAIEQYMEHHPMGISVDELIKMYRGADRSYTPKVPIQRNLEAGKPQADTAIQEGAQAAQEDAATGEAIDKAMSFYDIT